MLIAILFGSLVSSLIHGTKNYEACKSTPHQACSNSVNLEKAGQWSCKVQGKKLSGLSDCK